MKLRKIVALFLTLALVFAFCACNPPTDPGNDPGGEEPGEETNKEDVEDEIFVEKSTEPETPLSVSSPKNYELPETGEPNASGNVVETGRGFGIKNGTYLLLFVPSGEGYGLSLETEEGKVLFSSDAPAEVGYSINGMYTEYIYLRAPYSTLGSTEEGLLASARLTSAKGSVFLVSDEITVSGGEFRLRRTVQVEDAKDGGGYFSRVSFSAPGEKKYADCEYFVPSKMYRTETALTAKSGLAFADTRMGLPMAMLRDRASGAALSLVKAASGISTKSGDTATASGISSEYGYGSAGVLKRSAPTVGYTYPAQERGLGAGGRKFAAVSEDNDIRFDLVIEAGEYDSFNAAMSDQYLRAVSARELPQADTDLDRVYSQSMSDLSDSVEYRNSAWVLPFAVYLNSGTAMAYVAQSGYIGMQISLGAQLIRYGVETGDEDAYRNGFNMVNMWATTAVPEGSDSGVFQCYNNGSEYGNGAPTLRQLCDGMEGMLDALRFTESARPEEDINAWWEIAYGFANFLVRAQNADGSWYRAYDYDGNLLTENNPWKIVVDENTLADAKYNTQIPVRFLCRMFEYTGETKFLDAAKRAGDYVVEHVIDALVYRAGTLDTLGVTDRESGIFAMYAMTSLYAVTGEEKWLEYAEYATVYAMSWNYTYDFVVQNPGKNIAGKFLEKGYTAGLSTISHSVAEFRGADTFMGYAYADFFKMYLWTENSAYYDMALLVQDCQKRSLDLDGEYGYCKRSFACEATAIANMTFSTAENGVWLPWITNANIEAMVKMRSAFGSWDVAALTAAQTRERLTEMLDAYGAGGHAL